MRLFVKLMVAVLVVALAAPFFIKGPDGRPLMTANDFRGSLAGARRTIERQWHAITGKLGGRGDDGTATVYRWRDADGNWVYSDQPNPDGPGEKITVDLGVNVMDPTAAPPPPAAPPPEPAPRPADEVNPMIPLTLQPDKVEALFEDVREIESDAAQRLEELERAR